MGYGELEMRDTPTMDLIAKVKDIIEKRANLVEEGRCPYCEALLSTFLVGNQHNCLHAKDHFNFHPKGISGIVPYLSDFRAEQHFKDMAQVFPKEWVYRQTDTELEIRIPNKPDPAIVNKIATEYTPEQGQEMLRRMQAKAGMFGGPDTEETKKAIHEAALNVSGETEAAMKTLDKVYNDSTGSAEPVESVTMDQVREILSKYADLSDSKAQRFIGADLIDLMKGQKRSIIYDKDFVASGFVPPEPAAKDKAMLDRLEVFPNWQPARVTNKPAEQAKSQRRPMRVLVTFDPSAEVFNCRPDVKAGYDVLIQFNDTTNMEGRNYTLSLAKGSQSIAVLCYEWDNVLVTITPFVANQKGKSQSFEFKASTEKMIDPVSHIEVKDMRIDSERRL